MSDPTTPSERADLEQRVAEALHAQWQRNQIEDGLGETYVQRFVWAHLTDEWRSTYLGSARAVIPLVREAVLRQVEREIRDRADHYRSHEKRNSFRRAADLVAGLQQRARLGADSTEEKQA